MKAEVRAALAAGLIVFSLSAAEAQVIRVPGQQPTIQLALNAAGAGAIILVDPGTYAENLTWPNKVGWIRLIAVEGPDRTIIAPLAGTPGVLFPAGLGRTTVLEGFTLQGPGAAPRAPGIRIQSSPTVRFNVIRGFLGPTGGGGGIEITGSGARPLIDRNLIEQNDTAGSGGGIAVLNGASPAIRANRILDNTVSTYGSQGGGIYVGPNAGPAVAVVGNVIARNRETASITGGTDGVSLAGGTVDFINNTVIHNGRPTPAPSRGAGVLLHNPPGSSFRLFNNVVAWNEGSGVLLYKGGTGPLPVLDHNAYWFNRGGDLVDVRPGPNAVRADPKLVRFEYHLTPGSPLVDAGLNLPVGASAALDLDGDPRFLDGKLGGTTARTDIGADEYSPVRLDLDGSVGLGQQAELEISGPAGASYLLLLSVASANVLIQPYGQMLIGGPHVVLGGGTVPGRVSLWVPSNPGLQGFSAFAQGLVIGSGPGGTPGAFTNRLDVTLTPRARAIHEDFASIRHRDDALTTARWGSGHGGGGLHASYGYGGDGADGPLVVDSTVTLDSSTRTPGADGVVEWNFTDLVVNINERLVLTGTYPVRLNVQGDCTIDGSILLDGRDGLPAPPGKAAQVGRIPGGAGGPGGGAGGDANTNPNSQLGALPQELRGGPGSPLGSQCTQIDNHSANVQVSPFQPNCGGGMGGNRGLPLGAQPRSGCSGNGGGHYSDGYQTDAICGAIGAYGACFGTRWIVPTGTGAVQAPTSGAGGGAGGNGATDMTKAKPTDDVVGGSGGGGGGGLEIVAFGSITVGGTIHANGGSGGMGYSTILVDGTPVSGGWGGGGAGGSIWLSGTSVTVTTTAQVSAVGGVGTPNPPSPTRSGGGGFGYVIIRDRGGNPTASPAYIVPPPIPGRTQFSPPTMGKSTAVSRFYDSATANPQWSFDANNPQTGQITSGKDLVFLVPPATGQQAFIAFQGAPDLNGSPNPNPATWFPQSGFEPDITKLRAKGLRHIRFEIRFDIGPRLKGQPPPNRVAVRSVTIPY